MAQERERRTDRRTRASYTDSSSSLLLEGVEVRDDIRAVLRLLEAREGHARALHERLRVGQEVEHRLVRPGDARRLVGRGVLEAGDRTRGAADDAEQVGSLLARAALVA